MTRMEFTLYQLSVGCRYDRLLNNVPIKIHLTKSEIAHFLGANRRWKRGCWIHWHETDHSQSSSCTVNVGKFSFQSIINIWMHPKGDQIYISANQVSYWIVTSSHTYIDVTCNNMKTDFFQGRRRCFEERFYHATFSWFDWPRSRTKHK